MLRKKETQKEIEELSNSSNIIGKGSIINGDIESFGNIRVEGKLIGNIKSKSKVALGESSSVEGNILTQNAEVAGEIKGQIEVSELLVLKASAVIDGDIITNRLVIESGASFNGTCKMGAQVQEININSQERETSGDKPDNSAEVSNNGKDEEHAKEKLA